MAKKNKRGIFQSDKKSTRVRFGILALIFVSVVINLWIAAISLIAAPLLSQELHLTPEQMGLVFSAFGWAYAFLQIPSGWLLDRMRVPPCSAEQLKERVISALF